MGGYRGLGGDGKGEPFNEYKVSDLQDEKSPEVCFTTM